MSINHPRPKPEGAERHNQAKARRDQASTLAAYRVVPPPTTHSNDEEQKYAGVWPSNFTKGLPHTEEGVVDARAYELFVDAINQADTKFDVPLGPVEAHGAHRPQGYCENPDVVRDFYGEGYCKPDGEKESLIGVRRWESPLAGHVYDLQGPDAGSVAMERAPTLGSSELCAEVAEVYAAALLRDVPFTEIENAAGTNPDGISVSSIVEGLNSLSWFDPTATPDSAFPDGSGQLTLQEQRRRKARTYELLDNGAAKVKPLNAASLLRGSVPGAKQGPYISQFLLVGTQGRNGPGNGKTATKCTTPTRHKPEEGLIVYGTQTIGQRLYPQREDLDYMTDWQSWLDVQNGADLVDATAFEYCRRFITTPRDLASYVHYAALYQAYLNACLILLNLKAPFQFGFPSNRDRVQNSTRDSFATFGPPHILSLVTEAATRALKAVRRQKFNYHRRERPEVLGAMLSLVANGKGDVLGKQASATVEEILQELKKTGLLDFIHAHNKRQNQMNRKKPGRNPVHCPENDDKAFTWFQKNYLLPMAFPEGSPMHPAYGAGHATVAGACITMLKSFFQMFECKNNWANPLTLHDIGINTIWVASKNGKALQPDPFNRPARCLTLQGELNKLAANLSIGRNMAGVHYYTDYYDAILMGERIAVGILQEQMLTYPESVSVSFNSFDQDQMTLSTDGKGAQADVQIVSADGNIVSLPDWWNRHIPMQPVT